MMDVSISYFYGSIQVNHWSSSEELSDPRVSKLRNSLTAPCYGTRVPMATFVRLVTRAPSLVFRNAG